MDRICRGALLSSLLQEMRKNDSWCGETHIQKAVYFLQDVTEVPLNFKFVLYKHGPFSFDLRRELMALRADGILELEFQEPYGPRFKPAERSWRHQQNYFSETLDQYQLPIEFIASKLGNRWVSALERLATSLFVTNELEKGSTKARVKAVTRLKPHISFEDAKRAMDEVDEILREAPKPVS